MSLLVHCSIIGSTFVFNRIPSIPSRTCLTFLWSIDGSSIGNPYVSYYFGYVFQVEATCHASHPPRLSRMSNVMWGNKKWFLVSRLCVLNFHYSYYSLVVISLLFRSEYLHETPTTYLGPYELVRNKDELIT